ncbi:CIA30 family protein [Shewanella acanthi]|uniref:CIA30 family protein n=1 Tax=Shewanella acanthi TaxID=2864212 RepID=UPI001C65D43B|nr:CIA30 family protein [Shewanella acanthi]QYJ79975.1 CIA30 family protein [Shewanella acanthi]
MILFDFKELDTAQSWYSVNDTVMGGLSRSKLTISPLGYGIFSGHVSLANGGGFASVKSDFGQLDLSGFTGIYLELERDRCKQYKVNLKDADTPQSTVYQAIMPDPKLQAFGISGASVINWQRIEIPFSDFAPHCRGKPIKREPLDLTRLCSVGLVIGAQQGGDFSLKIKAIGYY